MWHTLSALSASDPVSDPVEKHGRHPSFFECFYGLVSCRRLSNVPRTEPGEFDVSCVHARLFSGEMLQRERGLQAVGKGGV